MTHALLYRPGRKWRVAVAFFAALLVHVAAVGFAALQHEAFADGPPDVTVIAEGDPPPLDNPPPSPEPETEASPPPILTPTEDFFPQPNSTPPPIQKHITRPVTPFHRSNGTPGIASVSEARVFALSAPRPQYPYEARRSRITGDGIVGITIDPISGSVTDVSMWKSTGNTYLDNAALTAFRRWRFKPGSVPKVQVPITFTLTGASY